VSQRLGGQVRRDVVEEGDGVARGPALALVPLALGLFVAGRCPPVLGCLTRQWDQARQQHQQLHGRPLADQRCGERAERLGDHDQVGSVPDGVDDGIGILPQAG
jgi:hypothetical protein